MTLARPDSRTIGPKWALLATTQVTLIAAITVTTVAAPAIQAGLHLDRPALVLVTSAYGLSFGGLLLLGGRLADRLGPRGAFRAGTALFGAASAAAAVANGGGTLVAARFAQGAGAALTAPAAMALAGALFPERARRRRAMAIWGVLSASGATAGTVLSGLIFTWGSWRLVFVPPVLVAVAAALAAPAPYTGPRTTGPIDWPGAVLVTLAEAALVYGAQYDGRALAAAVVLLGLFVLVERRAAHPLVPPDFARRRALPLAAVGLTAAAMASGFFLISLYLQQVRGLSPLATSLVFLLSAPGLAAAGPIAGRMGNALPAGLAIGAAGLASMSVLGAPYAGLLVFPFGAGLTFSAATLAVDHGEHAGLAGGLLNSAMETGPPLGLAAMVWLAAAYSGDPASGYAFALRVAAGTLLATALVAMHHVRGDKR